MMCRLFFFFSITLSVPFHFFFLFLKYDKYLEKNIIIQSKVPKFRNSSSTKSWNCKKTQHWKIFVQRGERKKGLQNNIYLL